MEEDPEAASAEYGAEFRGDLEIFITRDAIEACVAAGVTVRAPLECGLLGFRRSERRLVGQHDIGDRAHEERTGCSRLHRLERKAPFSPGSVVTEFAGTLKSYRISTVTGDRYAGEWPRERFQVHGIAISRRR